ncbi:hypothetical protein EWM64_g8211 [Hericium alpestre]|uniref:Protein kinase domain-containing protein n=1 Tax=Hericium alpestre TaxID=135208 RepID=A0A4Y9ZPP5_9AGAM|nr:hypothetical protein EWM64_g8211 [Hericium alpestre]
MADLYHLTRTPRSILSDWMRARADPAHPNTVNFPNGPFSLSDYAFSDTDVYLEPEEDEVQAPLVREYDACEDMPALDFRPDRLMIIRRINPTRGNQPINSAVFEVKWDGKTYVLKVNCHSAKDQEYGRDRHLTERNMYNGLLRRGLCEEGMVPYPHGYFHIWGCQHKAWTQYPDHWPYDSWLKEFTNPAEYPRAILMDLIPDAEPLPKNQFTPNHVLDFFDTIAKFHAAGFVHQDIESRHFLWTGSRFVIIDFDRAELIEEGEQIYKSMTTHELQLLWETLLD